MPYDNRFPCDTKTVWRLRNTPGHEILHVAIEEYCALKIIEFFFLSKYLLTYKSIHIFRKVITDEEATFIDQRRYEDLAQKQKLMNAQIDKKVPFLIAEEHIEIPILLL